MQAQRRRLEGRAAVVTGAARGIGRAIAERLASEGAHVACLDISKTRIETAVCEMAERALDVRAYVVDVGQRQQVHAAMAQIESDLGVPVSILVNNAVWARYQPIEEVDEATFDQMLNVGLKGIVWGTQAVVPQMKRAGSGSVINLSSAAAVLALQNAVIYCGVKAAVAGVTRACALELGPLGIRVNAIAPGMIDTPASLGKFDQVTLDARARSVPLRRFGQAHEVASVVAFLASAESSYMSGAMVMADGGITIAGT
jgi:NAD(P)-dependent dehydrogenase (short-subunit alcohol dehydrogenase family)